MFEVYFQGIVLTSLIGAFFAALLLIFRPLSQKHFSATWHYYIWLAVLVGMMVPVRLDIPKLSEIPKVEETIMHMEHDVKCILRKMGVETASVTPKKILYDEKGHRLVSPHLQEKRIREIRIEENLGWIAWCWGMVALGIMLVKLGSYVMFLDRIRRTTKVISCPEVAHYTNRKVIVRSGSWLRSPLLLGVMCPILLMPQRQLSEEQLHNILVHEMTHLRRWDMLYKWFVVVVKCVHWFNPVVYLVGRQINQECEVSCDLVATEKMSNAERMGYVDTILSLFTEEKAGYALTMGMAGSKKLLKKRFKKMKNRIFVSEQTKSFSKGVATVLMVTIMLVNSSIVSKAFPNLVNQNLMPAVTECSHCGEKALYNGRKLARHVLHDRVLVYYAYFYECEDCGHSWSRRQEVTSRYVIKASLQSNYSIMATEKVAGMLDYQGEEIFHNQNLMAKAGKLTNRELLEMVDELVEELAGEDSVIAEHFLDVNIDTFAGIFK